MSVCCICSTGIATDGVLADGSVFHTRCHEDLKRKIADLNAQESRLLAELRKPRSFFESISNFLFESRKVEFQAAQSRIVSQIHSAREEHEIAVAKLRLLYDFWPTYPPDWGERQREVNRRNHHSCSACGVSGKLHLHHIRALSQGGSNRLENIALLCEDCHSAVHGGRTFRYESRGDGELSALEKKIRLLGKAITNRRDIRFRYEKPDGTVTNRTVTPREMRKLSIAELQALLGKRAKIEKEGTLCLFGHCHLRGEKRTFAVHRMRKIEIK